MRIPTSWSKWAGVISTGLLFFWLSRHDYLLFHVTAEVFSAVVAGCVFILTLTLADTSLSSFPAFFVIVGCGQGFVAAFTLLHMAAYKGMQIFGEGGANLPTQLWIATRLIDTGALLVGVLMIGKTIALRLAVGTIASIAGVLLASLFIWPVFPNCFIEGVGLTPFKIAMEYMMMGVLAWAVWRLHSRRDFFSAAVIGRLMGAYVLHIVAGMFFTLYTDVYGLTNVLGHLMFFVSYLLIADSLLRHMVIEPQAVWFRDLYMSEVKFRSLTESSPDYIMRFDRQCRFTYVNPAGLRVTGRTEVEMIGKTLRENGFAEDRCIFVEEKIRKVLETAKPSYTEFEWNSPNGLMILDLRLTPEFAADTQVASVLSVSCDITERKQAEELLRRSAEIQTVLRKIAESAVLAPSLDEMYAVVYRLVGQVLPAMLFHINLLDEATGEIIVPFRADNEKFVLARRPLGNGLMEYIMRLGRTAYLTRSDVDRLRETGEVTLAKAQICHYIGAPLIDSQGKAFGVMSLILLEETEPFQPEDVEVLSIIASLVSMAIERKRAEGELVALCQKLEEASQSKSNFLANMSHELRTPLNTIIGFSEILHDKLFGPLNEKQLTFVENIVNSGRHLLSLINDILDTSKVEANKMTLELDSIDLVDICKGTVAMFSEKAGRKQIELSCAIDSSLDGVAVVADGRKVKQILYNLVDNGIKFNRIRGSVAIMVRKIGGGLKPSALQIVVEDTGIGVSKEDQMKLFQPFSQLTQTYYDRQTEGTGLGLALTKQLVELHGGTITLQSDSGKGCRFIVQLPLNQEKAD